MKQSVQEAGGYLVAHSQAPHFRVVLSVQGESCRVDVTDQGFTLPAKARPEGAGQKDHKIDREKITGNLSARADEVEIHHDHHSGILLRFRIPLHQREKSPPMSEQRRTDENENSNRYPTDLLAQRLNMISDFVNQACANFEQHPAQSKRMLLVFTAVLGGLTQDLQDLLTPELTEQAQREIRAVADDEHISLDHVIQVSATRLLAGIWGTGATEGVTAENWQANAPGLASACVQVARLTGHYDGWFSQLRDGKAGPG